MSAPLTGRDPSGGPLSGIVVLEVGHMLAGPYGCMLLADLGAEVIKIEPPEGDIARRVSPHAIGPHNAYFASLNRGKKSIVLDLASAAGQSALHALAARAHALIVNLRPAAIRKLGLTYEALKKANPGLVCVALTGYGLKGGHADRPAYDYVIQALTGVMAITGEPGGPPAKTGYSAVDNSAGMMGALGLLAKIVEGKGGQIDLAMHDVMLSQLNYLAGAWLNAGERAQRMARSAHPYIVPAQIFQTRDGWLVVFISHDEFWRRFCNEAGRPDWLEDARFATMAARRENRDTVLAQLAPLFMSDTTASWIERLAPLGVVVAPVETLERALASDLARERDMVVAIECGGATLRAVGNPIRIDGMRQAYGPPPLLGEHNAELMPPRGAGSGAGALPRIPGRVFTTVVHMLAHAARGGAVAEALVCGERRLGYGEYASCVAGFARELRALGARGERVATVLGNSIESCVAAYGALAAGAQHVPLNPLYSPRELEMMLRDAAPRVLIVDAALEAGVAPLAAAAGVAHLIVVGQGRRLLDAWRAEAIALEDLPEREGLALLQYTGGTTGRPKGVNLTHGAIAVNVSQREGLLPTREGERILCMMPVSHSYGMAMGLFLAAYCRGALVLLPRYVPEDVLAAVGRERITVFPGSPTVFTGLMAHPRFAATDWSAVHTCYSGASALAEETLKRWREAVGAPVYEGYGQTEAGPVLAFNPVRGVVKPGSVGIPLPQTEIQIVDLEHGTRPLPCGERGEIRARGPQIMQGYRNLPEETAQTLRDGWLYTGDIGEFDAEGYLYIRDRKKDMLIVGGYNVYPRELEEVLVMHPAVLDAAVVGIRDDYRGELPVAYVALRPGARAGGEELLAHCRANLARYKVPARMHILDSLPKTSVAKTDKKTLRQWAAEAISRSES